MQLILNEIILASSSKHRQKVLSATGLKFRAIASEVDESEIRARSGKDLALARAEAKALDVLKKTPRALVIGADQTLTFNDEIFGKVNSKEEAIERLKTFQGKIHKLHSAVVLCANVDGGVFKDRFCTDVEMDMRFLTDEEIEAYVDNGEWQGCVGCYQAENTGSLLFSQIGGDNSAVIGLPICELNTKLLCIGINLIESPSGPWTALVPGH